jgi:uncharacterized protein YjbJ (UPF0337 family)
LVSVLQNLPETIRDTAGVGSSKTNQKSANACAPFDLRFDHEEAVLMNWDQAKGQWTQMKGSVRKQWGKLTDDDLDVIAGEREKLVGKIQERYGIAKDEAEKQIANWNPPSGAEVSQAEREKELRRKAG